MIETPTTMLHLLLNTQIVQVVLVVHQLVAHQLVVVQQLVAHLMMKGITILPMLENTSYSKSSGKLQVTYTFLLYE